MATRNSPLPPKSHFVVADAVTRALAGLGDGVGNDLPPKVRDGLDYLVGVSDTSERIRTEQPVVLSDYVEELAAIVGAADAETLIGSHVMARLMTDVAAGTVRPVIGNAKKQQSKPRKRTTASKAGTQERVEEAAKEPIQETPGSLDQSPDDDF